MTASMKATFWHEGEMVRESEKLTKKLTNG